MKSHLAYLGLGSLLYVCTGARGEAQPAASRFHSRPDLNVPVLQVVERNASLQGPGYYFVAPYDHEQEAVHIYDNEANLVWTGYGSSGPGVSHSPHVCQYRGESHLCFYQGNHIDGVGYGHGLILNKHYQIVKSVEASSHQAASDLHEFRVIDDGKSALVTQYLRRAHDLCAFNVCAGVGFIHESAFQEIDVETGKATFEWRSLDHVPLDESVVMPSTTDISGTGSAKRPWDYFHINSVDRNEHGDYLISGRHVSTIYKISGADGHIVWRLGGAKSDFQLEGFNFSFQHDARFVHDNDEETVISVFDNGSNGFSQTRPYSVGLLIRLDHRTRLAEALQTIEPPSTDRQLYSSISQGSQQRLDGGNIVLGWGNHPAWTEYSADQEIAFSARFAQRGVMNYRVHKFDDWIGVPLTKPALWTYSEQGQLTQNANMWLYVSWNGATSVHEWMFFGSNDSKTGPWTPIGTTSKKGFETSHRSTQGFRYTYAVARDSAGQTLATSDVQETFAPGPNLRRHCGDAYCSFLPEAVVGEEAVMDDNLTVELSKPVAPRAEGNRTKTTATTLICGVVMGEVILLVLLVAVRMRVFSPSANAGSALAEQEGGLRLRSKTPDRSVGHGHRPWDYEQVLLLEARQ